MTQDEKFMEVAIKEALKGKGRTLPNPCVGAVIVKDGKIVSKGYHKKAGLPHAEVEAIENAKGSLKGATIYVTLEPCNHYGRTPPCTERIIKEGFKRVVIGTRDPNPVARGGIEKLKYAGVEVTVGVLERECRELIDDFTVNVKFNRAFLSLKVASTLDGKIATRTGQSKWITSEESRRFAHKLRSFHNAVMVGIGTVLKDDPLLNVRYVDVEEQPLAIVVDKRLDIPTNSRLLKERAREVLILTSEESLLSYKAGILKDFGVTLVPIPEKNEGLDILEFLRNSKEYGIYSIMVEGGSKLSWSLLSDNLIDKLYIFYAPKIVGGDGVSMFSGGVDNLSDAYVVDVFGIKTIGEDILVKGYLNDNILNFD